MLSHFISTSSVTTTAIVSQQYVTSSFFPSEISPLSQNKWIIYLEPSLLFLDPVSSLLLSLFLVCFRIPPLFYSSRFYSVSVAFPSNLHPDRFLLLGTVHHILKWISWVRLLSTWLWQSGRCILDFFLLILFRVYLLWSQCSHISSCFIPLYSWRPQTVRFLGSSIKWTSPHSAF